MPRFDANLTFLFREVPLVQRFSAARDAGFRGVELLSPEGEGIERLAEAARTAGVEVVLINAPMGDFLEGGAGLSGVPGREAAFRDALLAARGMALAFGCRRVHIGPSRIPDGARREDCEAVLVSNLRAAADILGSSGIQVLIEPLNTNDFPGVLLSGVDAALRVMDQADSANVSLQFDIYHMHQMESDPAAQLERNIGRIAHIQFADHPGRGEPGSGTIPFESLFALIDASSYDGWCGAEYFPRAGTLESLGWLRAPSGMSA